MIKIGYLSDLLTKENNLIRERQEERNKIDRDIAIKRSEVLSLQEAEREIKSAVGSMKIHLEMAESMLDSILRKIKRTSSSGQQESLKMQEYLNQLQTKIEQATEYFANAREIQMTVQDLENRKQVLLQDVENLKTIMREWNEAWNTKENSIKARENAVKNAEVIIQYDREQIEKEKFRLDEFSIGLNKKERDLAYREQQLKEEREHLLRNT